MNNCVFIGRLCKDPELKTTKTNIKYCRFSIAVDRGDKEKTTDFFMCLAWNKRAELVTNYFRKGSPIAVTGKMIIRSYEQDGQQRQSYELEVTEVNFIPAVVRNTTPEQEPEEEPEDILEF